MAREAGKSPDGPMDQQNTDHSPNKTKGRVFSLNVQEFVERTFMHLWDCVPPAIDVGYRAHGTQEDVVIKSCSRSRDHDYSQPPPRIRTGGFPASGSCLR